MIAFLSIAMMQAASASAGGVVGVIRDAESGRPVTGAVVVARDAGRRSTADGEGRYAIGALPAGPQRLEVRAFAHVPYSLQVVIPQHGALELDIELRPLPTPLPNVEVRRTRSPFGGAADALDAGDRVISAAGLTTHPQLPEPDFLRGVAGGDLAVAPETPGGLHVRGGSTDHTGYAIDGVPVFNPYHLSDLMGGWNADAFDGARLRRSTGEDPTLAGTLQLTTRAPGALRTARAGVSTGHARVAVDGPTGIGGVGFLVSARVAFPAGIAPDGDATFVRGESHDWLAKLEGPAVGGLVRLLATQSADELSVAPQRPDDASASPTDRRTTFGWNTASLALQWHRRRAVDSLAIGLWRSSATTVGDWNGAMLTSARSDVGAQAMFHALDASTPWRAGVRVVRPSMTYQIAGEDSLTLRTTSPLITTVAGVRRRLWEPVALGLNLSATLYRGRVYAAPGVDARWTLGDRVTLWGSLVRGNQFAQSLRNSESPVSYIFPPDLFIGAGAGRAPVARSEEASLGADVVAASSLRARVSAFARDTRGLILVALAETGPFARRVPASGRATSRGATAEIEAGRADYLVLARFGVQRVVYRDRATRFTPSFSALETVDGGLTRLFSAQTSVRLGVSAAFGRHVTPAVGRLEWESCNLRDRGCEFAGSPRVDTTLVGAYRAPPYVRLDLSVRKHMQVNVGPHRADIAVFGTYSNILSRFNVLTYTLASGAPTPVEMRPQSPFVVGLDWRF